MLEAAYDQALAGFSISYSVGNSFASGWYAVGVDDAFWHEGDNEYELAYLGWAYFHSNGTQFMLPNEVWHSYTDYDTDDGGCRFTRLTQKLGFGSPQRHFHCPTTIRPRTGIPSLERLNKAN